MDGFIDSQREDGHFDSSGEFRLDPIAAARKLREHTGEALWIPRWVQASVVAGASLVSIRSRPGGYMLGNDAPPLSETELRCLADPTVALGSPDRKLRHYSVSLLAGLGPGPARMQLGSWQDGVEHSLRLDDEQLSYQTRETPPPAFANWSQVEYPMSLPQRLVLGICRPLLRLVKQPLKGRLRFCPIPVVVDGTLLNQPLCADAPKWKKGKALLSPGSELDGGLYFLGDTRQSGAIPGFPVAHGRSLAWVRGEPGDPATWQTLHRTGRSLRDLLTKPGLEQQLAIKAEEELEHLWCGQRRMLACRATVQMAPSDDSVLWLVCDGVALQARGLTPRGLRVTVAASHLKTDLTGAQALEDAELESTLRFVDELIGRYQRERG